LADDTRTRSGDTRERRDTRSGGGPRGRSYDESSGGRGGRGGRRRRVCQFCADKADVVDYKDVRMLQQFVTRSGAIAPRRRTGACAKHQRALARAIKRARHLALLHFAPYHYH